jgi:hypothetical protein
MVVNDDAGCLIPRGDLRFIASMLAPTGQGRGFCRGCGTMPAAILTFDYTPQTNGGRARQRAGKGVHPCPPASSFAARPGNGGLSV